MHRFYILFHSVLMAAMLVGAMTTVSKAETYNGYEAPDYRVVKQDGPFELRVYAPHLVAEVQVGGSQTDAIGTGFGVLAKYIFGGNETGEKIAMTVPVSQRPVEGATTGNSDEVWAVRFMMPDQSGPLPTPENEAIRFVRTKTEQLAVMEFSGLWRGGAIGEKETELRNWIVNAGLTVVGPAQYFFYDGPMTLPWNRRNEVAFVVK
ncbi:MAG: hypothetical protein ACI853_001114 [Paracoccaceae bacterium]|jgi:hypothetical protein